MNPIYKFTLSANGGDEQRAFPIYRDDVTKDFELQTNQEFYRAKLSGKLTFVAADYDFIENTSFDTQFGVKIYISYDAGTNWALYWSGNFWKTNCKFDADNKNVTVTPDVMDQYTDVLAGMEKEYNLIELAPEIVPVQLDKRPMIQVYVPGQTVIGCFLSGMWWEQECESITDENALQNTYCFWKNKTKRFVDVTQQASPSIPEIYWGDTYSGQGSAEYTNGAYKFVHEYYASSGGAAEYFRIIRVSDNQLMWWVGFVNQPTKTYPIELTLQPADGSGATGNVKIYIHDISVWARYVCDVESAHGLNTYPIPSEDIVENNRNYTRVIGYDFPDTIAFCDYLTTTPTQWGLYQPGVYYDTPSTLFVPEWFPIARNAWGRISIWFAFSVIDWLVEEYWRKNYTLRDAYPLASVISVLLAQVAPGLSHAETTAYSQFLYGTNPLLGINQRIFITPKSNMISLGYDQPAQKAPVTLKRILDMLRDCFRCYWFVDDQNRFRIEHIEFFRRGGAYTGTPVVGRDLTIEKDTRNGKDWAFGTSQYQFDKPEMAARYQFGWMDDVTQLFDGNPIDIVSKYVNPDNIEQIDVSQFTSDVDYILLNPGEISKDGFVLLSATKNTKLNQIQFEQGTIGSNIGQTYEQNIYNAATRIRTGLLQPVNNQMKVTIQSGYQFVVGLYDEAHVMLSSSGFQNGPYTFTMGNAKYFTLIIATTDSANITPADVALISGNVSGYLYRLPYINFQLNNVDHILQNAYVAFIYLQQYYFWDMPARYFKYNGEQMAAQGIKMLKTQTLKFPAFTDPNTLQLIKTGLGNGTIQKMSVNLSSRMANTTLKYDTE